MRAIQRTAASIFCLGIVTTAGCGSPPGTDGSAEPSSPAVTPVRAPVATFEGTMDVQGNMTVTTHAPGAGGLHAETVPTGSGANTVTLHTLMGTVAWAPATNTLTGNVELLNNFTTTSQGLTVEIDSVSVTGTTYTAPWNYSDVTGSGTSGTITWSFTLPSATSLYFTGHLDGVVPSQYIAYDNATLRASNQSYGSGFGMDFVVSAPITVSSLGAYDANAGAGQPGLGLPVAVWVTIWNTTSATEAAQVQIPTGVAGTTLMGGQRFVSIAPVVLPAGNYSVVTFGNTGGGYHLWNSSGAGGGGGTTSGGGKMTFVGSGRNGGGTKDTLPTNMDSGPANRYSAGTFIFQ